MGPILPTECSYYAWRFKIPGSALAPWAARHHPYMTVFINGPNAQGAKERYCNIVACCCCHFLSKAHVESFINANTP
jgi:hypothetical protein